MNIEQENFSKKTKKMRIATAKTVIIGTIKFYVNFNSKQVILKNRVIQHIDSRTKKNYK